MPATFNPDDVVALHRNHQRQTAVAERQESEVARLLDRQKRTSHDLADLREAMDRMMAHPV